MSKVEIESFFKSFILFFGSLGTLIAALFYINFTQETKVVDDTLFSEMRLCSYDLQCEKFYIDFIPHKDEELYKLYKDDKGLSSYYPIPGSTKNIISFNFNSDKYADEINRLKKSALFEFAAVLAIVFILSIIFSIYALYPLKNALLLTQEFIKDILHDFNTPLSSLRLNSSMLKREIGENEKVSRIEQSVESILSLQEHLRSYLQNHSSQKEKLDLKKIIQEKVSLLEKNYPQIDFHIDIDRLDVITNKEAISRIIDNLLSNAAKYNKPKGSVTISYSIKNNSLIISDTGKGIKNPKKIFERFYKEQDRGIGIGLHIVKKLCDELNIKISVESALNEGSSFSLKLSELTLG